ncbi:hypothetical protein RJ640_023563 [Escallonia rubra]|uniref:Miraculin n=1 Tax=Escallonia rubra TaxID=112253 RepID=A0AA88UCT3_9ASTE|nr:hypothetical protein RJ640_023563 [Escallonia rubra]
MRTTLLFIPLLLSALLTFSLGAADAAPNAVLDTAGKKLRTGVDYYILPVVRGRGGGLTLARTRNETCPLDVVQEQHEVDHGIPLVFAPVDTKKGVIRVSTDHNIKFSGATIRVQSTVWKLNSYNGQHVVTTGGVEGNPGRETIDNWFKIEKYEDNYKLVFCPTVCNYCKVICKGVGILIQNGRRQLTLSDVPFKVMFKKA